MTGAYTVGRPTDGDVGWQVFDPAGKAVRHRGRFRSKGSAIRRADGLNSARAMMARARPSGQQGEASGG